MLEGNRCERCLRSVEGTRANHHQTRYCIPCAKVKKRQNSLDPWTREERQEYMKRYMREYRRKRPGLSTPYVRKNRSIKKLDLAAAA